MIYRNRIWRKFLCIATAIIFVLSLCACSPSYEIVEENDGSFLVFLEGREKKTLQQLGLTYVYFYSVDEKNTDLWQNGLTSDELDIIYNVFPKDEKGRVSLDCLAKDYTPQPRDLCQGAILTWDGEHAQWWGAIHGMEYTIRYQPFDESACTPNVLYPTATEVHETYDAEQNIKKFSYQIGQLNWESIQYRLKNSKKEVIVQENYCFGQKEPFAFEYDNSYAVDIIIWGEEQGIPYMVRLNRAAWLGGQVGWKVPPEALLSFGLSPVVSEEA